MTAERPPESESPMVDGQTDTTPWEVALDRLQHPAPGHVAEHPSVRLARFEMRQVDPAA